MAKSVETVKKRESYNLVKEKIGNKTKNILKYIAIFVITIAIFIGALVLSSVFPRDWIQKNTEESAKIIMQLGNPSRVLNALFDNDTDTLMVNNAYSMDPNNLLESALLGRRNYLPEKEQTVYEDVNVETDIKPNEEYIIQEQLIRTVNNTITESYEYARYWHGYVTILRPLLIFFNYNEIREIMIGVLALLAIILLMILYKKISFKYCFVIIISLIASEYFLMGFTLQGLMTFIICMISSILICIRYEKIKNIGIYFFVIGMVTCYFDLLTHPIITLGVPMIIYLLLKQEKEQMSFKETIKFIILNTLLWGIGWGTTNLAKWVIVDILYDRNLVHKSIVQFIFRSQGSNSENLSWYAGLQNNWKYALKNTIEFIILLFIYVTFYVIKNYKNIKFNIKESIPYLIISLMPIAWFLVMVNHTWFHYWFTWRNLIIFYIGIGTFLLKLFSTEDVDSNKTKKEVEIIQNQKGNEVK